MVYKMTVRYRSISDHFTETTVQIVAFLKTLLGSVEKKRKSVTWLLYSLYHFAHTRLVMLSILLVVLMIVLTKIKNGMGRHGATENYGIIIHVHVHGCLLRAYECSACNNYLAHSEGQVHAHWCSPAAQHSGFSNYSFRCTCRYAYYSQRNLK